MPHKANQTSWPKGVSGNPAGRPKMIRLAQLEVLSVMARLLDPAAWARIIERAIADAQAGDAAARSWLSRYSLPEAVDPWAVLPGSAEQVKEITACVEPARVRADPEPAPKDAHDPEPA
jgi:hypothetical protein